MDGCLLPDAVITSSVLFGESIILPSAASDELGIRLPQGSRGRHWREQRGRGGRRSILMGCLLRHGGLEHGVCMSARRRLRQERPHPALGRHYIAGKASMPLPR